MDDIGDLMAKIEESHAYLVRTHLEIWLANYYVFDVNHAVLSQLLAKAESPKSFFELWPQEKLSDMQRVMRELMRLLHNFLASAMTLINHTRITMNDWYSGNPEFLQGYQTEVWRYNRKLWIDV